MNPPRSFTLSDGGHTPLIDLGAGTAVLLVHGWTLDHRSFEPQYPLADTARLISYDRRGFGRCSSAADLEREPSDIIDLLDQLSLERVVLLGVSQGGRIALRTACAFPDRFSGLILQGAPLDGYAVEESPTERIPLDDYRNWVRAGRIADVRAHWLAHPLMRNGLQTEEQCEAIRAMVASYDGRDLVTTGSQVTDWQVIERLPTLPLPIMTITGSLETESRQQTARKICALATTAVDTRISGAGHLSNLSHAADYNACIRNWLGTL